MSGEKEPEAVEGRVKTDVEAWSRVLHGVEEFGRHLWTEESLDC